MFIGILGGQIETASDTRGMKYNTAIHHRSRQAMGVLTTEVSRPKPKLREAEGYRYTSKPEPIIPVSKWSSNHCKHLRVEVTKTDQPGVVKETCQCGATRTLPGYIISLQATIKAGLLKGRLKPSGEGYQNSQCEVQLTPSQVNRSKSKRGK